MDIYVTCQCGEVLRADASCGGQWFWCPACGTIAILPPGPPPKAAAFAFKKAPGQPVPWASPAPPPAESAALAAVIALQPVEHALMQLLRSFLPLDSLCVAPDLEPRRVRNATASCLIPPDEWILAMIDCTVMGSAKNAFCFCRRAAYFHNSSTMSCRGGFIPYAEFPNRIFSDGGFKKVRLDQGQELDLSGSGVSKPKAIEILQAVQRLIGPFQVGGYV